MQKDKATKITAKISREGIIKAIFDISFKNTFDFGCILSFK
jgi:hypothetical protein